MSARDIFNRRQQDAGSVLSNDMLRGVISVDGVSWVGSLIQGFQATYSMPVNTIYEMGTNRVYTIRGRSKGELMIAQIIGLNPEFPAEKALFDACNSSRGVFVVRAESGLCDDQQIVRPITWTFRGLQAHTYSISSSTEGMLVSQQIGISFTSMSREP